MIRATNLSKFYGGKRALGPVSFEINDGETVGFLGLNGAGKTTALRILACDLRPERRHDRGRRRRCGRRSRTRSASGSGSCPRTRRSTRT